MSQPEEREWPVHEFTMKEILVPRTPMRLEAAYDPTTTRQLAELIEKDQTGPQLISIWRPFFLMSGVGQTEVLVKRFRGHVWFDIKPVGSVTREMPFAEITITPTEGGK